MAGFTRVLIYLLVRRIVFTFNQVAYNRIPQGIVAWPVAKLLELVLGSHHGIIYRRAGWPFISAVFAVAFVELLVAELKELIAMHSSISSHGGDLKTDTVTIIGATLDLQEKVVKQVIQTLTSRSPLYLTVFGIA
jgi:metal transporter CNNM